MEFVAEKNPEIVFTMDGKAEIRFKTSRNAIYGFEMLKDIELDIQVKKHSLKRSKSQNAYMWELISQLADKLRIKKEDVYRSYIKDYGSFEIIPIKEEAVDLFISSWQRNGLGWVCEIQRASKLSGYVNLIAYYGSSIYTSDKMSVLIDAIIQDCEEQGIPTLTLSEIMLLKNENDKK